MNGTFDTVFNETGFPSFMAVNFQNNDSSADQRPSTFCGLTRTSPDWYTAANPDSPYNKAWFSYMASVESYLSDKGYLDRAYYYMANEPQDQADYDAAWYSQELKKRLQISNSWFLKRQNLKYTAIPNIKGQKSIYGCLFSTILILSLPIQGSTSSMRKPGFTGFMAHGLIFQPDYTGSSGH